MKALVQRCSGALVRPAASSGAPRLIRPVHGTTYRAPARRMGLAVRDFTLTCPCSAPFLRARSDLNLTSLQKSTLCFKYGAAAVQRRDYATKLVPFLLADIGEGISEVEVLQWYVKEGARVQQFTPLCEVQSDKATVPISSRFDGVIRKLRYKVGDMAKVGSPLCDIEVDEGVAAPATKDTKSSESKTSNPSGSVKESGDEHEEVTQTITTSRGSRIILAAPAVRFLAKQNQVDLAAVKGSGKDGRVTKGDLLQYIQSGGSGVEVAGVDAVTTPPIPPPLPTPPVMVDTAATLPPTRPPKGSLSTLQPRELAADEVIPLRGFARAMVQTMTQSLSIPHLGLSDEIDMTALVEIRTQLKPLAAQRGVKLTYMPFFIKAASLALKSYPLLNSKLLASGTEVTLLAAHNIAIAVDTPAGLVVPNIKHCERRSVVEIALELQRIVSLAQQNKLPPEDLQGSTFSLSNIGAIGGTYASPVLVVPQVCIGALGKIQRIPRFNERGEVVAKDIMNISWSADHRVIDGGTIANFSNLWKQYLEQPASMLFDAR